MWMLPSRAWSNALEGNVRDVLAKALILLCHKFRRRFLCIGAAQHGHLGNVLARATIRRCRIVAIEFGTCRWVRSGGASGAGTVGNGRGLERPRGASALGGHRLPLRGP